MARAKWTFGDPDLVTLTLDATELLGAVDELVERQLPFAQALALTRTAIAARDDLRRRLPGYFTIRNRYVGRGIRSTKATKRDQTAMVGSVHPFMRLHVFGGERRPKRGATVGIPVKARPTRTAKTTLARFPSRVTRRGKGFVGVLRNRESPGVWAIKGGKRRERQRLVLMYTLQERARVRKSWPMAQLVERTVARVWADETIRALDQALRTAKRRRR